MGIKFSAQQKSLGLSQCERLCGRGSRDVEALAFRSGWRGTPGEPISISVASALNMLILSIAMNYGVELSAMVPWLPGLRTEALLKLGEEISNWSFHGPAETENQFWTLLYGSRESVRPRIASLLRCCGDPTTRLMRYHSQAEVECLSETQIYRGESDRVPRFYVDAHELAGRVQTTCGAPLFIATAATQSYR